MSSNPVYCRIVKINRRQAYRAFRMGVVYGKTANGMMFPVQYGNALAAANDLISLIKRSPNHRFYLLTSQ